MERDSLLYKTRRKLQVLAHQLLPDKILSKFYYFIVLHKFLNIDSPKTFNDKIQWLKLYYYHNNPLIIKATDKYKVREYIAQKGLEDKLVPLYGVWSKAEDINWNILPKQFVLKCNHGCAYNIVVPDKEKLDKKLASKQLNEWLQEDFGAFNIELHYSKIKQHKIICEKFLGETIQDYKFFCFNGIPRFIYVSNDLIHDRRAQIGFFYLDGKKMPLYRDDYTDIAEISLPSFYDEMLNAAKVLCKDYVFVRVDFFVTNQAWYFAELTFTPSAGMLPFNPVNYDLEWGKLLDISNITTNIKE